MKNFKTIWIVLGLFAISLVLMLGACDYEATPAADPDISVEHDFDGGVVVNGEFVPGAFTMGEDPAFPTYVPLMHILAVLEASVYVQRPVVTVEGLLGTITFEIGSYDFDVDGETITLPFNSFEVDGTIYVPIPFFREVFGMNNAYVMDGTVFINNDEVME